MANLLSSCTGVRGGLMRVIAVTADAGRVGIGASNEVVEPLARGWVGSSRAADAEGACGVDERDRRVVAKGSPAPGAGVAAKAVVRPRKLQSSSEPMSSSSVSSG